MSRVVFARVSAVMGVGLCALVVGCGAGDDGRPTEPQPVPSQGRGNASMYASNAVELPHPPTVQAPVLQGPAPAAPKDDPLPLPATAKSSHALDGSPAAARGLLPAVMRETVASGLKNPTSLAFSSDGTLFYTELERGLFARRSGLPAKPLFQVAQGVDGERSGMLAVVVDAAFASNRHLYVLTQTLRNGTRTSRVLRLTADTSNSRVEELYEIFKIVSSQGNRTPHTVEHEKISGTLRLGPDSSLYVGLPNDEAAQVQQTPQAVHGKILRIGRDGLGGGAGSANSDRQAFASIAGSPASLSFHPYTGELLVAQRSAETDSVDLVRTGGNVSSSKAANVWQGDKRSSGVSSIEILRGPMWRNWANSLVIGLEGGKRLEILSLAKDGTYMRAGAVLEKLGVGFKAVVQGPNGLYVITSGKANGEEIWRMFIL